MSQLFFTILYHLIFNILQYIWFCFSVIYLILRREVLISCDEII